MFRDQLERATALEARAEHLRLDFLEVPLTDFRLREVPALPGLCVASLPHLPHTPPTAGQLIVTAPVGADSPRGSLREPHSTRLHILRGALLWWQESAGEDPKRYAAGDTIAVAPNEPHGFLVLEDYVSYNVLSLP